MPLVGNLAYVAICSFAMSGLTIKFGSLASRLLTGLTVYVVPEDQEDDTTTTKKRDASGSKPGMTNRSRKKMSTAEKEDEDYKLLEKSMGGAGYLSTCKMPRSVVEAAVFFPQLDNLVYFTLIMVFNCLLGKAGTALRFSTSDFTLPVTVMGAVCVLHALVKTELLGPGIPRFMRIGAVITGLVNFALALVVLVFAPSDVLDFSVDEVSKELMPTVVSFLKERNPKFEPLEGRAMDPLLPSIALALIASFQGALMFGPAHRAARMYFKLMGFSITTKLVLHLQLLLPVVAIIMWFKPMAEMWGLKGASLAAAQPVSLLLAAFIVFVALRPMLQAYLNLALQYWYDLKHAIKPSDMSATNHAKYTAAHIRVRIEHNKELVCKVAIQLFSHGALLVAYGVMLHCGSVEVTSSKGLAFPLSFWRMLGGFLGWWACISWFAYVAMGLIMHRIGIITS